MYTLHHDAEIRSIDQIEELSSLPAKVKPEEMKLAKQVIATFDGELNLKDYKDDTGKVSARSSTRRSQAKRSSRLKCRSHRRLSI